MPEDETLARRFRFLVPIFFCLFAAAWASAQTPPLKDSAAQITIGPSVAPLYRPWKLRMGDSPLDQNTHGPLWADPAFDDSQWETVDLTPQSGRFDPNIGISGYVPGWTAKGHPGYSGYAWYRIRVRLTARPGENLALAGPLDMDDGYQVFANGALLGSFGDFSGKTPIIYYSQPRMFPLLKGTTETTPQPGMPDASSVVLAFRVWMEPYTLTNTPDAGGFHTAPLVGDEGTIAAEYQNLWVELIRSYALAAVEACLFLLLAVVSFSLILFDRTDRVYGWMGVFFLLYSTVFALLAYDSLTESVSVRADTVMQAFTYPLATAAWVMVWWVWFRLHRPAWLPRAVAGLLVLLIVSDLLGQDLFADVVPHTMSAAFHVLSLVVRLAMLALTLWIVVEGIRLHGLDGWLALPAVLLYGIARFQTELGILHVRTIWFPFGLHVSLSVLSSLLLIAVLALLLLRRLLLSVHRQRLMALDVKQAQEVQQVILPEAHTMFPGLKVECEYRPALEVGGDFFQIVPHATDGSLLIVAGDVAGKGLKAGMLVALLIGAIRTAAQFNPDPLVVMETLNQRLLGRGDCCATCLALRIDADGSVSVVNAGHVAPYLNGQPVAIEGSLPLGLLKAPEFSMMRFRLLEGDRLMLLSDGIVEATDKEGQLFGFARVQELLRTASSASQIASAAQSFGQEDDISVISVTRVTVLEAARA